MHLKRLEAGHSELRFRMPAWRHCGGTFQAKRGIHFRFHAFLFCYWRRPAASRHPVGKRVFMR